MRAQETFENNRVNPAVSFIIPALNEAQHIRLTIGSIRARMSTAVPYEIIVVDHGSTDGTAALAEGSGAKVLLLPLARSIAALRNEGAEKARGKLLVFIDADVTLTAEWSDRFPVVQRQLLKDSRTIAGSLCMPPENGGWLQRYWFGSARAVAHVGTGHMIVCRAYFRQLGGFREDLETGEDYDLCERVRRDGGTLYIDPKLRAVHDGFPKDLRAFIKREAWHGRGDIKSIHGLVRSKVALAAVAFLFLHLIIVAGLVAGKTWIVMTGAAGLVAMLVASSLVRYAGARPGVIVINGLIFYFYYLGRCLSFAHIPRSHRGRVPTRCETNPP